MKQLKITLSDEIKEKCPDLQVGVLTADVKNSLSDNNLGLEIENEIAKLRNSYQLDKINKRCTIAATREAYKRCGKDPNRYRPSAEALCRRILRDMDLYRINTIVDLINLISIHTGHSIGGFDADKIVGNLTLGIGKAGEPFEAIGRGALNIEGLPVYRDDKGGIGTPTSDEERTKLSTETTHLLLIVNAYGEGNTLPEVMTYAATLIQRFAEGERIEINYL